MKKVNPEGILKLFTHNPTTSGVHEGTGLTTEEIGEKLGIGRDTALLRVKKLIREGKLKVTPVRGVDLCGRRCQYITYEATNKERKL